MERIFTDNLLTDSGSLVVHRCTLPNLGVEVEFGENHLHHTLVAAAIFILTRLGEVAAAKKVAALALHPVEEVGAGDLLGSG